MVNRADKTCRKKQHVKIDDMKEMSDLFCSKAAVGGNYNLTRDNHKLCGEDENVAISYNKLWKLLIDKNMKKMDLRNAAGISTNALAKLGKNKNVSTGIMEKICLALNCQVEDIMEITDSEDSVKREEK